MSTTLPWQVIIGISIGVALGVLLTGGIIVCLRMRRKAKWSKSGSEPRSIALPIRVNGVDSSVIFSDASIFHESKQVNKENKSAFSWWGGSAENTILSHSGVPRYSYRDLLKATDKFSTLLGEGAFGSVYKATLPEGAVAVKVLSSKSNQGEKEFLTELRTYLVLTPDGLLSNGVLLHAYSRCPAVSLLGRLHHRNLVNLLGYCAEKDHRILVYEYMENGSLAQFIYGEDAEPLSWDFRVQIAQDVSRGIEYLHDGASPPVIHRDIKSSNILLDKSMSARVADFGLSKEADSNSATSSVRGTLGYVDPEYILTNKFTEKSDVYSFGMLLFELVTARNPQQGLLEYVQMAAMSIEGKEGWEEILDSRLNGECDLDEVGTMAHLAYTCINKSPRKRPWMRDVTQTLTSLRKQRTRGGTRRSRSSFGSMDGIDLMGTSLGRLTSIAES